MLVIGRSVTLGSEGFRCEDDKKSSEESCSVTEIAAAVMYQGGYFETDIVTAYTV